MSSADHAHIATTHEHHELGFLRKYIFSEDHKIIGIQFLQQYLLPTLVRILVFGFNG